MTENWKNIDGYEGLYQISNLGRVKSLNYNRTGKERLLKPGKDGRGYLKVNLWKNGKRKPTTIHRLVAQAFIKNPLNLPQVNHMDEDKENNSVDNLEWCNGQYNIDYSQSIKIDQFTKSGTYVKTWLSSHEAERNGYQHGHIIACCKNKRKSHKGYIWKYHIESED